ncbi:hypothetical protein [Burkholderia sp. BCC1998]|uniref:hypothetical protein n=1 Tax=Burkholderia sp. BCC1998 TaxID=2817447 RepID=UPI002AB73C58|nr:hypothetical protein [Burkholderia sp. BCC1998]
MTGTTFDKSTINTTDTDVALSSFMAAIAASAILGYSTLAVADAPERPSTITFAADQLYPETASWSEKEKVFFVSSIRHGTVGKVAVDGQYTPFISDNRLVSTVGLLADDAHNTLWVINADPGLGVRSSATTQGKLAGVAAYDESTGALRAYYDLTSLSQGAHFANDLSVDDAGNAYVSDSFAPMIFRIGTDGKASILVRNETFGTGENFNLNGIAWAKDGFLIVGNTTTGELFRVSTADPVQVDKIKLSEPLIGVDGFHLMDRRHLVIVQQRIAAGGGGDEWIKELVSTDGWKTARVVRRAKSVASAPTSVTQVGNTIYALASRIDTLANPKALKVSDYVLQKF